MSYLIFAGFCGVLFMFSFMNTRFQRRKINRMLKIELAKAVFINKMLVIEKESINIREKINKTKLPLIHEFLAKNTAICVYACTDLTGSLEKLRLQPITLPIKSKEKKFIDELTKCPKRTRELVMIQSSTMADLYKVLHPWRHRLSRCGAVTGYVVLYSIISIYRPIAVLIPSLRKNWTSIARKAAFKRLSITDKKPFLLPS